MIKNTGSLMYTSNTGLRFSIEEAVKSGIRGLTPFSAGNFLTDFIDINGDGLPDRVAASDVSNMPKMHVQLNNGSGFRDAVQWGIKEWNNIPGDLFLGKGLNCTVSEGATKDFTKYEMIDMNGDGFIDRVAVNQTGTGVRVQFNTGNSFTNTVQLTPSNSMIMLPWEAVGLSKLKVHYSGTPHTKDFLSAEQYTIEDLIDITGDGYPDMIKTLTDGNVIACYSNNKGLSFRPEVFFKTDSWKPVGYGSQNNVPALTYNFINPQRGDHLETYTELMLIDINGDGLLDRVQNKEKDLNVYLNTGSSFIYCNWPWGTGISKAYGLSYVRMPKELKECQIDTYCDLIDLNGDNLPDRVSKEGSTIKVQWNTGHSFSNSVSWVMDQFPGGSDLRLRSVYRNYKKVYDNNGIEIGHKELYTYKTEMDFIDINGDGFLDRMAKNFNGFFVQLNNMHTTNLLKKIRNKNTGTIVDLEYYRTYNDENPNITGNFSKRFVLGKITTTNSFTQDKNETTISYRKGIYDRLEREFRGFEGVDTETIVKGATIEGATIKFLESMEYHVSDLIGMDQFSINPVYDPYLYGQMKTFKTSVRRGYSNPIKTGLVTNNYISQYLYYLQSGIKTKIVYPKKTQSTIYDDQGNFLANIVTTNDYKFNNYLGLLKNYTQILSGDPYNVDDDLSTSVEYIINTKAKGHPWFWLPSKIEIRDIKKDMLYRKNVYYDNQNPDVSDMPVINANYESNKPTLTFDNKANKHNLTIDDKVIDGLKIDQEYVDKVFMKGVVTAEKIWNNSSNYHPITRYSYDTYGNLSSLTNYDKLTTKYETRYQDQIPGNNGEFYLQTRKTYPDDSFKIINFDNYGRVKKTVNSYGETTEFFFDNFGRISLVDETMGGGPITTRKYNYFKTLGNFGVTASYINKLYPRAYLRVQNFKDPLGRHIQTKKESEVNGVHCWIVSGKLDRDALGRVKRIGAVSRADIKIPGIISSPILSMIFLEG